MVCGFRYWYSAGSILIERTFEALKGVKNAIVHIYNSTSTLQREVVFKKEKEEIKQIAIDGTKMVKKYAKDFEGNLRIEYSPESFTGTELDYALEVCDGSSGGVGSDKGKSNHYKSSGNGGDDDAECICGSD